MREIKFRGKRKDTGEWIKGSYVCAHKWHYDGDAGCFIVGIYSDRRYEIDPDTLGQYTGLKDKNGVEIYEGDIVKCYGGNTEDFCICVIGIGVCKDIDDDEVYGVYVEYANMKYIYYSKDNCIEIIGNIYDNPELLKGDKQ